MDDQQHIDAWARVDQHYQLGQEVRGVVTRVTQFGVFVQVEPGLEGIIYAFELGAGPAMIAGFTPGQEISLYIKNIDVSRKRLELSLNNDPTPWLLDERALPREARVHVPQTGLANEQIWPTPFSRPPLPLPDTPAGDPFENHPGCPRCQREVQVSWKFCVYCGEALQRRCSICGSVQPNLPDARYCCECGQPL